jgi:hypothetical protein
VAHALDNFNNEGKLLNRFLLLLGGGWGEGVGGEEEGFRVFYRKPLALAHFSLSFFDLVDTVAKNDRQLC